MLRYTKFKILIPTHWQQKIRNMRKNYSTEDITMFERNSGLLLKLRDGTAALHASNCIANEELINALWKFQVVTVPHPPAQTISPSGLKNG